MKLVDINVIGNLTREDNVISGFSTSNYGMLYAPFNPKGQDFEIGVKFKTSPTFTVATDNRFLFHFCPASTTRGFTIHIQANTTRIGSAISNSDDSGWITGNIAYYENLQADTTYWIKAKRENNVLYCSYSLDGVNYTITTTQTLDFNIVDLETAYVGVRYNPTNSEIFDIGKDILIDLSECYIDVAGERFWSGCRNPNTNYYTYDSTFKDITLTGSPTVSNGEISGFSTSKYATTTVNIPITGIDTFEVGCKFTTGTTYNNYMQILSSPKSGTHRTGFDIQLDNSPRKVMLIFYDNDTYFGFSASDNIADNTTYWCKWVYNGTNLKSYYSYDGVNYILNNTNTDLINDLKNAVSQFITGTTTVGINPEHTSAYVFTGSIDLKQCYIKINDETVWTGTYPQVDTVSTYYNYSKENSKYDIPSTKIKTYYKYGKVPNVTVTGTPTIENAIIKTFTTANYTQVDNLCNTNDNIDYIVKFRSSDIQTLCVAMGTHNYISVEINAGNITSYNFKTKDRDIICPIEADKWYYIKVNVNGSVKKLYYSLDGINWTLANTITTTSAASSIILARERLCLSLYDFLL